MAEKIMGAILRIGGLKMEINGVYYTEPELAAKFRQMQETIDRYEAENRKLTEEKEELGGAYNDAALGIGYLEQRCEELEARAKEYKRLLKAAVEVIHKKCSCECSHYKGRDCDICVNEITCDYDSRFQWVLEAEALKLIGGEDNG